MEMKEVTRFLNIKDNTAQFSKEKGRRKVEIQEVKAMKSLRGPRRSPLAALLLRGGTQTTGHQNTVKNWRSLSLTNAGKGHKD